jgi:hypothetical protein
MHHIVARVQADEFLEGYGFFSAETIVKTELMVTLEDLVVGIIGAFQVMVRKSLMEGL